MKKASEQHDPYQYSSRVKWPVILFDAPFFVPVPEGFGEVMKSVTFRVPMDLERTIEAHCQALGVSKSEWFRNAQLHLLSIEQQWLAERGIILPIFRTAD
jgi:hypothetical protein